MHFTCVGRLGWPQHKCCSQVRRLPLWSAPASTFGGQARRHGKSRAGANQQSRSGRGRWTGVGHVASHPWQAGACLPPVLVSRPLPLELWGPKFSRQVNSILPQGRQVQTDGTLLVRRRRAWTSMDIRPAGHLRVSGVVKIRHVNSRFRTE
jgi:hypothetical protein